MYLQLNKGKAIGLVVVVPFLLVLFNGCSKTHTPNPDALLELGTYLFFDDRLSGDGSISCATCHNPEMAYSDGLALSKAYPAAEGFRNSPSLLSARGKTTFYADGRLSDATLLDVTQDMIENKLFLNMHPVLLTERMKQIPVYDALFWDAFGEEPTFENLLVAIDEYLTSLSPAYEDRTEAASRGLALFEGKANCASCHTGSYFTDSQAHNTGVPDTDAVACDPLRLSALRLYLKVNGVEDYSTISADPGRYAVTGMKEDLGAFFTPSLWQVADTAPYMHNGSFSTLKEVLQFYNDRGDGLGLNDAEMDDIIAFLHSLSGALPEVQIPVLPEYAVSPDWRNDLN